MADELLVKSTKRSTLPLSKSKSNKSKCGLQPLDDHIPGTMPISNEILNNVTDTTNRTAGENIDVTFELINSEKDYQEYMDLLQKRNKLQEELDGLVA